MKPHPYQVADIERIKAAGFRSLLAIEPGGGKTVTSLFCVLESGAKTTLIIAPKGTHESAWGKTTRKILGQEIRVVGNGNKHQKGAMLDLEFNVPGVYIMTPQLLPRLDVSTINPEFLIVDEGHMLNNPGSKGQRKLSGYGAKDTPIQATYKLFLSGTPIRKSFERAWSIGRFLWPELYRRGEVAYDNYYGWLPERMTYQTITTGRNAKTGELTTAKDWLVERVPGKWVNEIPSYIFHSRRTECCEFHPNGFLTTEEPNVVTRTVELTPDQKKAIRQMEKSYIAWFDERPMVAELTLTQRQRIRTIAAALPAVTENEEVYFPEFTPSPVLDEAMNIIEQVGDEPVVVFCESQQLAALAVRTFKKNGISAFEYSGKTVKTRDTDLAKFGTEYQVVVIGLAAGGTGLDGLQEISKTEIWIETSVDPVLNQQAEARVDRLGAREQVQRFVIVDDMGYASGQMSNQLVQRIALAKSLRKEL